jgi:hypothetical protein
VRDDAVTYEKRTEWGWAEHFGLVSVDLVVETNEEGKRSINGIVQFLDPPRKNGTGPVEEGPRVKPFDIQLYDKIVLGGEKILEFGDGIGKILGVFLNEDHAGLVSLDRFHEHERYGFTFKAAALAPQVAQICEHCGEETRRAHWRGGKPYCSLECMAYFIGDLSLLGEKNP